MRMRIKSLFLKMALPTGYSCVSALALAAITLAIMQVFKNDLGGDSKMTILGGFIGSCFFFFLLTAVGNAGALVFGSSYNLKLFPEVAICMMTAMFMSALVHRVCVTTCLLFSLFALYYVNKISQSVYSQPQIASQTRFVNATITGKARNKKN